MSVQYQHMKDDNDDDDDEVLSPLDSPADFPKGSSIGLRQVVTGRELLWPGAMGCLQITLGVVISLLGLFEVLILPITDDHMAPVQFGKATCYGVALYAGLMMVISGSVAVRATLTKRKTTVYSFYHLALLTLLVYFVVTVVLVVAYSQDWNDETSYPANSSRSRVHVAVTVLMVVGLMSSLTVVVHYQRAVCFGEVHLWHWWTHCICNACSAQTETEQSPRPHLKSGPVALLV